MLEAALALGPVVVVGLAYAVRAHTLAGAGRPVPLLRVALFGAGLAALAVALSPPLAGEAEDELLVAHMGQHILLADMAPALLLAGLTGPLLRPLLAVVPPALLRVVQPWPALAVALVLFLGWHVPFLFDAAARHEPVHVAEHLSFVAAGLLVWLPLLETLPGPAWFGTGAKLAFVLVWRTAQTVLGNVLLWAPAPVYAAYAAPRDGVDPLDDQRLAAALMMGEGTLVTLGLLVWLGARMLRDAERRQTLVEAGVGARVATRATRYGRDPSASPPAVTPAASTWAARSPATPDRSSAPLPRARRRPG
jgi:cytochrome c oxidase assembly factor CtaG